MSLLDYIGISICGNFFLILTIWGSIFCKAFLPGVIFWRWCNLWYVPIVQINTVRWWRSSEQFFDTISKCFRDHDGRFSEQLCVIYPKCQGVKVDVCASSGVDALSRLEKTLNISCCFMTLSLITLRTKHIPGTIFVKKKHDLNFFFFHFFFLIGTWIKSGNNR